MKTKKIIQEADEIAVDPNLKNELIKQALTLQTAVIKFYQFALIDVKDAVVSDKAKKIKAAMEELTSALGTESFSDVNMGNSSNDDRIALHKNEEVPVEENYIAEAKESNKKVKLVKEAEDSLDIKQEFDQFKQVQESDCGEDSLVTEGEEFDKLVESFVSYYKKVKNESAKAEFKRIVENIGNSETVGELQTSLNESIEWANKNNVKVII